MFIGHSLGSLIIKQVGVILARIPSVLSSPQALVLADHGNTFRDIRLSTARIIFLGTPHQGSEAAVYGVWQTVSKLRTRAGFKNLFRSLRAM